METFCLPPSALWNRSQLLAKRSILEPTEATQPKVRMSLTCIGRTQGPPTLSLKAAWTATWSDFNSNDGVEVGTAVSNDSRFAFYGDAKERQNDVQEECLMKEDAQSKGVRQKARNRSHEDWAWIGCPFVSASPPSQTNQKPGLVMLCEAMAHMPQVYR